MRRQVRFIAFSRKSAAGSNLHACIRPARRNLTSEPELAQEEFWRMQQ